MSATEYFLRTATVSELEEFARRLSAHNDDHVFDGLIGSVNRIITLESA